jgi:hypothetical protein
LVSAIVGAILILFIWHWVHNWSLMGIKQATALERGEVTCAWMNCRAATR